VFGMMKIPNWVTGGSLSSAQLLVAAGALLICAAILLLVRRKTMVELQSNVVTTELMAYLARIADALERPRGPSTEEVTKQVLLRLQEIANGKPNGKEVKGREIPFSMFGREVPGKE
jgi:hypothetical protein